MNIENKEHVAIVSNTIRETVAKLKEQRKELYNIILEKLNNRVTSKEMRDQIEVDSPIFNVTLIEAIKEYKKSNPFIELEIYTKEEDLSEYVRDNEGLVKEVIDKLKEALSNPTNDKVKVYLLETPHTVIYATNDLVINLKLHTQFTNDDEEEIVSLSFDIQDVLGGNIKYYFEIDTSDSPNMEEFKVQELLDLLK